MSYPSLAPGRSPYDARRRRRRMIVLAVVAFVVALVALAVRYRTEERRAVDYLAVATGIAQNQVGLTESLKQTLTDIGGLERQELLNQIDSLGARVSTDARLLAEQDVPPAVAEAHGYLTVAIASWQDAITALDDAVLTVLDSEADDPSGALALAEVFELLRVGDRAYLGFLDARSRIEVDEASGPIAEVDYVAAGSESLYDGETIATRLRAIRRLGGRHDISVTARTEPGPLGSQNGIPVVPASETFSVLAVITNEGNLPEEQIPVRLQLQGGRDDEPIVREQLVLALEAGQATTIEFSDLELLPGELYNLQITAQITQDADPFNNRFQLDFYRNQEA